MPSEVQALTSLEHHEFMEIMSKYLYESIGTQEFARRHMLTQSPCIVVPSTLHISLTKAATILGLGRESLVPVAVNENSRMDPIGWYSFCPLSSFSPQLFFLINNIKPENGNRTNNCKVYLININKMRVNQVVSYIWKWITFTYSLFVTIRVVFQWKKTFIFYEILDLNRILKEKLDKEIPVITVVAVTGTTEQGAVDSVTAVVYLREKFRMKVRITVFDLISKISYTVKTIKVIIIIIIIIIIMIIIICIFIVITIIHRFLQCNYYIDLFLPGATFLKYLCHKLGITLKKCLF